MRTNMINRRKQLGLTQEDIANHIGRKRNTVSSYETGKLTPTIDIAIKLKQVLKTNEDSIFLNKNVI